MDRWSLSDTQKRLLKVIAAGVVALVAFFATLGQPPEHHEEIVRGVCEQAGLKELAEFGGLTEEGGLCTHGTDPKRAFVVTRSDAATLTPVVPSRLCKGDGTSGARVHAYVVYPSTTPPADQAAAKANALKSMGYAEAQLRASHDDYTQGIRWLCEDGRPVVTFLGLRTLTKLNDAINALPRVAGSSWPGLPNTIHVFFATTGTFDYCGVGTIMFDDESKRQGADGFEDGSGGRAYSLIAPNCQGASDTTLHELGHNIGAVNPNAPHDSGDWHCYSFQDVMCYEDGGPYFEGGGQMIGHCAQSPYWVFDCRKDDYWNPRRPTTGYFATHWNTADSPFLSTPRHR